MSGNLAQRLQIPAAGRVIRQKFHLGAAWQPLSPFFEAQYGKRAHQTDSVDLVYLCFTRFELISQA
jgi:hypothetical protein